MRTHFLAVSAGVLLVGIPLGSATAQPQQNAGNRHPPVIVAEATTTSAVVEDVDPQTRQVLLRLPDNTLITVKAGSDVKTLAQLKPGDRVMAQYVRAKLVGITPQPDHPGPLQAIHDGPQNTKQGDTTVVAVDPTGHTVAIVGPDNVVQTFQVAGDAQIQALTKLHPGGRADVAYTPDIAVALNPA